MFILNINNTLIVVWLCILRKTKENTIKSVALEKKRIISFSK